MKLINGISLAVAAGLSFQAFGAHKVLECVQVYSELDRELHFKSIIDTADFAKENPLHEGVVLKYLQGSKPIVESMPDIAKSFYAKNSLIGETFRVPYKVTSTTISLTFNIAYSPVSTAYPDGIQTQILNINRGDLSVSPEGSCKMSDYKAENML